MDAESGDAARSRRGCYCSCIVFQAGYSCTSSERRARKTKQSTSAAVFSIQLKCVFEQYVSLDTWAWCIPCAGLPLCLPGMGPFHQDESGVIDLVGALMVGFSVFFCTASCKCGRNLTSVPRSKHWKGICLTVMTILFGFNLPPVVATSSETDRNKEMAPSMVDMVEDFFLFFPHPSLS